MDHDTVLIQQTLVGDADAFAELVEIHYRPIYALVLQWTRQREDAEEITQDVFVKAHDRLASLREPEKFAAWLRQIARRQCQSLHRRKRIDLLPLPDDLAAQGRGADEELLRRETLAEIFAAIDYLSDLDEALIRGYYLEETPYAILQKRYGLTYKAITMRVLKARRAIHKKIHASNMPSKTTRRPPVETQTKEQPMHRHTFPTALFPAKQDDRWGYIDRSGNMVIKPQFDRALGFADGLARVGTGDKHGFIDAQGKIAIPLEYDWAYSFSEGLAAVKADGRFGYIDAEGRMAIKTRFDDAADFREGFAGVQEDEKWGFIDKAGAYLVEPIFDKVWSFSDGLGAVLTGNRYGYVDGEGQYVWWPEE